MTGSRQTTLAELRDGPLHRFADWPNPAVPNGNIGVYTVWRDQQLLYAGMTSRAITSTVVTSELVFVRLPLLAPEERSEPVNGKSHVGNLRSGPTLRPGNSLPAGLLHQLRGGDGGYGDGDPAE
jgi:hypothetical protein